MVATNIFRNMSFTPGMGGAGMGGGGGGFALKTPEQGAATSCYVATNPALTGVTGLYFSDCNPEAPSSHQTDPAMAARLWAVSEDLVGDYLA